MADCSPRCKSIKDWGNLWSNRDVSDEGMLHVHELSPRVADEKSIVAVPEPIQIDTEFGLTSPCFAKPRCRATFLTPAYVRFSWGKWQCLQVAPS